MKEFDNIAFYRYLSSSDKGMKNSGLNRDSNHDLCNTGAMLCLLRFFRGSFFRPFLLLLK